MWALVYTAPRHVGWEDYPRPRPAAGESEIAILAAGICGYDISGFLGNSRHRTPPMVMGHELVGRRPDGRRVVANPLISCGCCSACLSGAQNLCADWRLLGTDKAAGCYAEFVSIPESQIYEIPEDLSDTRAVMAEPFANIVHLFRIITTPFFHLGIVGAGAMGAMALQMAIRLGARETMMLDVKEVRLKMAREMGATLAVNVSTGEGQAEARRSAGYGLDCVIDACGIAAARQSAFDLCRPGGLVVLLGMSQPRSEIDFATSIRKEHRVAMSFGFTPLDFERSLELLKAGEIDLTPWTMEMPMEQGQQAFDQMSTAPGDTLKMLLRVN